MEDPEKHECPEAQHEQARKTMREIIVAIVPLAPPKRSQHSANLCGAKSRIIPIQTNWRLAAVSPGAAETRGVGEGTALPNGYLNYLSPRRCQNGMV
jgi:hypothetical protein